MTEVPEEASIKPIIINRVTGGWLITPRLKDPSELHDPRKVRVFTDFIEMCGWLGEYYDISVEQPKIGFESTKEGIHQTLQHRESGRRTKGSSPFIQKIPA